MKKNQMVTVLIYSFLLSLIILSFAMAVTSRISIPGGYRTFLVTTGSMSPRIPKGAIIISQTPQNEEEIKKDAIITFEEPGYKNKFITHRVYQLVHNGDDVQFITKGDANSTPDNWMVSYEKVQGIYKYHIPIAGEVFSYIKTPLGLVLLVIAPTVFLVFHEIKIMTKIHDIV